MSQCSLTDLRGQRATLLGFARTNMALARFLIRNGADVTITDAKPADQLAARIEQLGDLPVRYVLGHHEDSDFANADIVFVTPGATRAQPMLALAAAKGVPISSEIELFFELCPHPIAAITGSAGKTTTTTLVGEMLRRSDRATFIGGNIGAPLIDRLDEMTGDARIVLELSSFQLEPMRRSPRIGAVLNVTPNHLDRHPSFDHYRDAKAHIVAHQRPDDTAVLGLDDPVAAAMAGLGAGRTLFFSLEQPLSAGACLVGDRVMLALGEIEGAICKRSEIRPRGGHNLLNVLAAATVAGLQGATLDAIRAVATSFEGVEHRIEPVITIGGARWYNDSKATSPAEAIAALRSFDEPIVLLAGGRSKRAPLEEMAGEIARRVRALVVFGELADEIVAAVEAVADGAAVDVRRASSLDNAVEIAHAAARPGDVVLLSPSGSSFDAFRDYEERGRAFKSRVLELAARSKARP